MIVVRLIRAIMALIMSHLRHGFVPAPCRLGRPPHLATLHGVRRLSGVMLALVVALAVAPAASAHARLIDTRPAAGAILATAPTEVLLLFDDPVGVGRRERRRRLTTAAPCWAASPGSSTVTASSSCRCDRSRTATTRSAGGSSPTTGTSSRASSPSGSAPPVQAAGHPRPVLSAASTRPGALDVLARWLYLGGILLAGGGALFHLLVSRGDARRLATTMAVSLVGVVLGGAWLLHATNGGATRFDHVTELAVLVAAAGVAARRHWHVRPPGCFRSPWPPRWRCSSPRRSPGTPSAPGTEGRCRSPPTFSTSPLQRSGPVGSCSWRCCCEEARTSARVRRFSLLALPAVALIALSGLARALVELTAVSQLWSTGLRARPRRQDAPLRRPARARLAQPEGARRPRAPAPRRGARARRCSRSSSSRLPC